MDFVHLKRGKPVCVRKGSVDPENITEEYECADLRVSIGSDHGGFAYKQQIIAHLKENGYLVLDLGCPDTKSVDYPEFGMAVGRDVSYGKAYFGVVVCTSGIGISIAANKVPGIRCGLAYDDVVTSKMREHNNANVIAFGQKYMKLDDVLRRLDIFLCTSFSKEAKHRRRVAQISD
ncbi:MAG: RpiB/LacA/LacB family sugar-phosphate isomerase [Bacilli bacterium]|nr:RpiB/LacA/LacB family sugar-phosphate isomerase [Bacilli bacterium]